MKGLSLADPTGRIRPDDVQAAIDHALTAKQREAVRLFFFEGLSQSAIARRLGVSQQVIQRRLHGSRRRGVVIGGALPRLRAALAPLWEAHSDRAIAPALPGSVRSSALRVLR